MMSFSSDIFAALAEHPLQYRNVLGPQYLDPIDDWKTQADLLQDKFQEPRFDVTKRQLRQGERMLLLEMGLLGHLPEHKLPALK